MAENGLTTSDILALKDSNGGFGGENGFIWFLLIAFMFNGGLGGTGYRGDYVTQGEFMNGLNAQSNQATLQQILLSSANNNYETAQLIDGLGNQIMQQNNANQLAFMQAFGNLSQSIAQLGYQLDSCCCSIKTQMLEDRLQNTQTALLAAQNEISNDKQTQNILSTMGRWVGWVGSGTQTASTGT